MNQQPPREMVVGMLDHCKEGDTFEVWPRHITIVPWINHGKDDLREAFLNRMRNIQQKHSPIVLKGGEELYLGQRHDRRARRVLGNGALHMLQSDILSALEACQMSVDSPHVGDGYIPHVTDSSRGRLEEGEEITLDRIQLVGKQPDELLCIEKEFRLLGARQQR